MSMDQPKTFFRESEHPLAELYRERVKQNRDLVVLITDSSNDRGTGKTTEALRLAYGMDRTDEGITNEKVAMDPRPLAEAYTSLPKGSSLVLDESEVGLDKYRAGSAVNRAIRELVATGRVMEKYLVLNAPADHLVDKDLKSLVDVWVLVERRGFANVYRMDWSPHQGHELTRSLGTVSWDPIPKDHDLHGVYEYLAQEKEARLKGEDGNGFVSREEAREMVEEAQKDIQQEVRDAHIARMAELEYGHKEIAEVVGLSRSRISQIVAESS